MRKKYKSPIERNKKIIKEIQNNLKEKKIPFSNIKNINIYSKKEMKKKLKNTNTNNNNNNISRHNSLPNMQLKNTLNNINENETKKK